MDHERFHLINGDLTVNQYRNAYKKFNLMNFTTSVNLVPGLGVSHDNRRCKDWAPCCLAAIKEETIVAFTSFI